MRQGCVGGPARTNLIPEKPVERSLAGRGEPVAGSSSNVGAEESYTTLTNPGRTPRAATADHTTQGQPNLGTRIHIDRRLEQAVEASRLAQGFTSRVTDPAALRRITLLLAASDGSGGK